MTKKFSLLVMAFASVGLMASCSSTGTSSTTTSSSSSSTSTSTSTSTGSSSSATTMTEAEQKKELIKAFYEFTFSTDGFELAEQNGGIISDADYEAAEDFNKNDYTVFSMDNSDITINVGGSTSVQKISDAQIDSFEALFVGTGVAAPNFVTNRQGSGTAVSGLKDGTMDVGYLSRELKDSELSDLTDLGGSNGHFAIDAVVPIVNPSNTLTNITGDQLSLIYGARSYLDTLDDYKDETSITTWSQLGVTTPSGNINPYTRDSSSGTRECFTEKIGISSAKADAYMTANAAQVSSNGNMISAVAGDENAIGYVSLDSINGNDTVKALNYEGVTPSVSTVVDGTYLLQRYFNIVAVF